MYTDFRQSAHPVALFFLYFFRTAAIVVYLLCGFFTSNYVLSVSLGPAARTGRCRHSSTDSRRRRSSSDGLLELQSKHARSSCQSRLSARTQNVSGRTLVGLRYWNQVDEDGESYWVFECRDVSVTLVTLSGAPIDNSIASPLVLRTPWIQSTSR